MSNQPAPGWHPDPSGDHKLRYWDGTAWTDQVATGTLTTCPSCAGRISPGAPLCPHCGHPIHPTKTGATKVLVFGISSLLPGYGLIFGPLAWAFGNHEIREIDAGLRMPSGRRKARTGRLLGTIGLAISALIVTIAAVTFDDAPPQASAGIDPKQLLAEHGIEFVYPAYWEEMNSGPAPQPLWRYRVTPDQSSGNWIMFLYVPTSVAEDWGATEETFGAFLDVVAGGDPAMLTRGPDEIEIAGVGGLGVSIAGLEGSRTGQPLLAEAVVLYGEEASYVLIVQYEPAHQETMLSAWQTMLANLELPQVEQPVDAQSPPSPADLGHPRFDHLDTTGSSLLGGAWYDEEERYMAVLSGDAYHQHCGVSARTWAAFTEASSFDSFYYMSVAGRFDCRNGGMPQYDDQTERADAPV